MFSKYWRTSKNYRIPAVTHMAFTKLEGTNFRFGLTEFPPYKGQRELSPTWGVGGSARGEQFEDHRTKLCHLRHVKWISPSLFGLY